MMMATVKRVATRAAARAVTMAVASPLLSLLLSLAPVNFHFIYFILLQQGITTR